MGLTGDGLVSYATSMVGTPYFYGAKMEVLTESLMTRMHNAYPGVVTSSYIAKARRKGNVNKINVDCSGLIYAYTKKLLGSSQLYQQAKARLSVNDYENWANGVVAWRSGHVGVFFKKNGKYYVAEAKGIDYGTVISEFKPKNWSYGLTFSWMEYSYAHDVSAGATTKGTNPYVEPTVLVCTSAMAKKKKYKAGSYICSGEGVKWVQWELNEAGCVGKDGKPLTIDGDFGSNSEYALEQFQKSCKITADKICGSTTRKYLKAN